LVPLDVPVLVLEPWHFLYLQWWPPDDDEVDVPVLLEPLVLEEELVLPVDELLVLEPVELPLLVLVELLPDEDELDDELPLELDEDEPELEPLELELLEPLELPDELPELPVLPVDEPWHFFLQW
jgi:hypothetical protein